jgi:hypothetical protein
MIQGTIAEAMGACRWRRGQVKSRRRGGRKRQHIPWPQKSVLFGHFAKVGRRDVATIAMNHLLRLLAFRWKSSIMSSAFFTIYETGRLHRGRSR